MLPLTARRNTLLTTLHYYSNSLTQEQVSKVFKHLRVLINCFLFFPSLNSGLYCGWLLRNLRAVLGWTFKPSYASFEYYYSMNCSLSSISRAPLWFSTFVLHCCHNNRNRSGQVALTQVSCIASASVVPQNCLEQKRTWTELIFKLFHGINRAVTLAWFWATPS